MCVCVSKVCKGQRARTHTYTDTHSVHILRKAGHKMVAYMTQPIQRGKKKKKNIYFLLVMLYYVQQSSFRYGTEAGITGVVFF